MEMKRRLITDDYIRIHTIDYRGSICDGPGIRTVIFLQGCEKHCSGCHNPQTWDLNSGKLISISEIVDGILIHSKTKRITISGGEPLLQIKPLLRLMQTLKAEKYEIALYTGYNENQIPSEILMYIEYIKYGSFMITKKSSTLPYIGSSNQVFKKINL